MISCFSRLRVHLLTMQVIEALPHAANICSTGHVTYLEIRRDDGSSLKIPMSSVAYIEELPA